MPKMKLGNSELRVQKRKEKLKAKSLGLDTTHALKKETKGAPGSKRKK